MRRRVRLVLAYDGGDFVGSQVQAAGRTVQGELEIALARVASETIRTVFAGRTDKGVHAVGQVVSFDTYWGSTIERLQDALNAVLPKDLVVSQAAWANPTFHARYDACWREYRYRLVEAPVAPVLDRRYVWWRKKHLDALRAEKAAVHLLGRHRFGSFAGSGRSQRDDGIRLTRTVRVSEWRKWEREDSSGCYHEFRVEADGFLPQMVRNMMAALVQVAQGDRPIEWIDDLLTVNDRRQMGEAAPPHGLVLWRVRYNDETDDSHDGSGSDGEYGIR